MTTQTVRGSSRLFACWLAIVAIACSSGARVEGGTDASPRRIGYNGQGGGSEAAVVLAGLAAANASVNVNGQKVTNAGTPTASTDLATKGYVDGSGGFTAGGDLSGTSTSQTVARINGTTVATAGGSLSTGLALIVTASGGGSSTADWKNVDASKIVGLFVSPAEVGQTINTSEPGNFTVAIAFYVMRPCTWIGNRFYARTGSLNWKIRAYDATGSSALASATASGLASGVKTILFSSGVAITDVSKLYVASAYETSGTIFPGMSPTGLLANYFGNASISLLGPNVMLYDSRYFAAGDAQPTGGSLSSEKMAVEPVITIP